MKSRFYTFPSQSVPGATSLMYLGTGRTLGTLTGMNPCECNGIRALTVGYSLQATHQCQTSTAICGRSHTCARPFRNLPTCCSNRHRTSTPLTTEIVPLTSSSKTGSPKRARRLTKTISLSTLGISYDAQYPTINGSGAYRPIVYDELLRPLAAKSTIDLCTKNTVRVFLSTAPAEKQTYVIMTVDWADYPDLIEGEVLRWRGLPRIVSLHCIGNG